MVTCYVSPGKAKSKLLCDAFAEGCGGTVADPKRLAPGWAFFYGVVEQTVPLWRQALAEGRALYCDNSYFDRGRERYFRITKNAVQLTRIASGDPARLAALGVRIEPWRQGGRHIVVVEQSEAFLRLAGCEGDWLADTLQALRRASPRPITVRRWNRDKGKAASTLASDLRDAWCLITHMSAAANEALLSGVPVFVTGPCAATPLASGALSQVETPLRPEGREAWAAGLASNQWTIDEIRRGIAWKALDA